jgi:hypothetical protein
MADRSRALPPRAKVRLWLRIWRTFAIVVVRVRRAPLPDVVRSMRDAEVRADTGVHPRRLGKIVERVLRIGPWRARCLLSALVLYRLLEEQGEGPQLVIGMPARPKDKIAHAWVELDGVDVGPPPGSVGHEQLVRYP